MPEPTLAGHEAGYVVVGGGVHGLSAAWRLAERGADVLVLEKDRIGSGASGIAGGIVRNYYRSPAVTDLIRQSVEMFEADPEGYGFRQVGYVAAVPRGTGRRPGRDSRAARVRGLRVRAASSAPRAAATT